MKFSSMIIFDKIIKVGAAVGAVTVLCTSGFGVYSLLTKKIIEKDRIEQSGIVLKQEVSNLKESVDKLVVQSVNITDTLGVIYKNQVNVNKQVKKINNGLVNHFKQTERIEELFNWTLEP
jgi:hypothetical protein